MAVSKVDAKSPMKTGTDVITTSHDLHDARSIKIGKLLVVNFTIATTSSVSSWRTLAKLKDFSQPSSSYFACSVDGAKSMLYVGLDGTINTTNDSIASGKEVKAAFAIITG